MGQHSVRDGASHRVFRGRVKVHLKNLVHASVVFHGGDIITPIKANLLRCQGVRRAWESLSKIHHRLKTLCSTIGTDWTTSDCRLNPRVKGERSVLSFEVQHSGAFFIPFRTTLLLYLKEVIAFGEGEVL